MRRTFFNRNIYTGLAASASISLATSSYYHYNLNTTSESIFSIVPKVYGDEKTQNDMSFIEHVKRNALLRDQQIELQKQQCEQEKKNKLESINRWFFEDIYNQLLCTQLWTKEINHIKDKLNNGDIINSEVLARWDVNSKKISEEIHSFPFSIEDRHTLYDWVKHECSFQKKIDKPGHPLHGCIIKLKTECDDFIGLHGRIIGLRTDDGLMDRRYIILTIYF